MKRRHVDRMTVCLASAAVLACGSVAGVAQTPTFGAKVEAVRVDALVTDRGKPLRGLGAGDFEVRDNGVPQQVDLISSEQLPVNVVLVLDASASVAGDRLDHLRAAAQALVDGLRNGDRTALITFNHLLMLGTPPTTDRARVREAIRAIRTSGETALFDATYTGIALGQSDVGHNLVVVFSDGLDTQSYLRRETVVDASKRADVVVYAVSAGGSRGSAPPVSPPVNMSGRQLLATMAFSTTPQTFLRDITEQTGGRLYRVESTRDLSRVFQEVLAEFRDRYVFSYTPRGVAKDGWHRIDVRVKNRRVTVKARAGYQAGR